MVKFTVATLLSAAALSIAAPTQQIEPRSQPDGSFHIDLVRKAQPNGRSPEDFLKKAQAMRAKYGVAPSGNEKRATGAVTLTDYEDSQYYGTINLGTPSKSFNVIMDTGSADLIMAQPNCNGCSSSTVGYSTGSSSTGKSSTTPFSVQYGSGDASGTLASDTASIAGYTLASQTFGSCSTMDNIVQGPISGLLGLGWQPLANSGAKPLVQALAQSGKLPNQEFGFKFLTAPATSNYPTTMAGGKMSVGTLDSTAYTGSINWIPLDSAYQPAYWQIPMQSVTVNGKNVGQGTGGAVIDSGTTLIGAPQAALTAIYNQIPGSAPYTLQGSSGYYSIPCNGNHNVSLTFGGVTYPIAPSSFNAGYLDNTGKNCLGAAFNLGTSSSSQVQWVVGDTFMTGVYSAFRFNNTPAVGFAKLA